MKTRNLGNSGLVVSEIGFGAMGMSMGYGVRQDRQDMIQVLRDVYEMGERFYDTAEIYGPYHNEELVGEALAPFKNDVTIASKVGIKMVDGKQVVDGNTAGIEKSIEGSLKRLQIDTLDLYYLHRVDPNIPIEEIAETMSKLKKAGKIRHWGLSEAGVNTIRKAHAVEPLAAVESEYSLWTREPEEELLPTLRELGIGFVPFSPLGKGFLTGKIKTLDDLNEADGRAGLPRFQKDALEANLLLVEIIEDMAKEKNATPAQIALAWLLAQGDYIVPIPGTTKAHRAKENMGASDVAFTADELSRLTTAANMVQIVGNRYTPEMQARVGL